MSKDWITKDNVFQIQAESINYDLVNYALTTIGKTLLSLKYLEEIRENVNPSA